MRSINLSAALLLTVFLDSWVQGDLSSGGGDVSDSIPLLASGKRQHNIMRFGKRPSPGGHGLVHFGKRDEPASNNKGHSFLYFGKRAEDDASIWDYLGPNRDPSYKRGHAIMRFGKRGPDSHNFIRFGRDSFDSPDEDEKRANNGHAMMYFGKRGPDSHNFIRFGRDGPDSSEEEKRANTGHSMMYFGKRGNGHSMMYFGKRDDFQPEDYEDGYADKRAHSMIHFGKREGEDNAWEGKRAHAMIHFGKRDSDGPRKSGSHAMIHFGKRDPEDDLEDIDSAAEPSYWSPEMMEMKRQHNLLRFGKKDRKGSHAMIHFGKRDIDEDKRAHAMIHFGKRSADDTLQGNQSNEGLSRVKRESPQELTLVRYEDPEEDVISSEEGMRGPALYGPELWNPLEQQRPEEEWDPSYMEYNRPDKKDGSKNVFLRFG